MEKAKLEDCLTGDKAVDTLIIALFEASERVVCRRASFGPSLRSDTSGAIDIPGNSGTQGKQGESQ